MARKSVLFVCLGNICRSPIAEAIFIQEIKERGMSKEWDADSAGTADFNLGMSPDDHAVATLRSHGIECGGSARQVCKDDFF
ncbi:low molecular weight phosphotyrosine protein phosphatase-like isoform X1 [Corticium candelabrum]|uniref:low molecular weight phosphotyrosine protein phosphatase-like isoform X1 n=2 Tax=Corticium candelabrum TaxID=121492 RepID=UPI002E25B3EA|nr:low molecular weight phosphotyrosine protein phosphatase-like isoform X1 [Corticium candelabrum]XP_062504226.1 low molecular weight phosphotyrosine protein phosphatase-like isoform X1 [Corticium candelabrum]